MSCQVVFDENQENPTKFPMKQVSVALFQSFCRDRTRNPNGWIKIKMSNIEKPLDEVIIDTRGNGMNRRKLCHIDPYPPSSGEIYLVSEIPVKQESNTVFIAIGEEKVPRKVPMSTTYSQLLQLYIDVVQPQEKTDILLIKELGNEVGEQVTIYCGETPNVNLGTILTKNKSYFVNLYNDLGSL